MSRRHHHLRKPTFHKPKRVRRPHIKIIHPHKAARKEIHVHHLADVHREGRLHLHASNTKLVF